MQKLLAYIGEVVVNGTPNSLGATGAAPSSVDVSCYERDETFTFILCSDLGFVDFHEYSHTLHLYLCIHYIL